jgi:hypothetical protein
MLSGLSFSPRHKAVAHPCYTLRNKKTGGQMGATKTILGGFIDRVFEGYANARLQYDDDWKFDRKHQAQAKHFCLSREMLPTLRINQESLNGIHLNNAVYCLKRFLADQTEIIEEGNYEQGRYSEFFVSYPIRRELEITFGVFEEVWAEVTLFFKWRGETFCIGIKKDNEEGGADFKVITKDPAALKTLLDVFREYKKQHHYLKGKKFIGLEGQLLGHSPYGWNDIVLPDNLAERVRAEVDGVLCCAGALARYGLNSKKGFILAGDPGNGKTLLLKILVNTIDVSCILVPFNKHGAEKSMSSIFQLARILSPTILILEDIDLYGGERGHSQDGEYLGELMNELDGMIENKEIIVFATTNHLEKVEKALQNRPGRFDRVYKIVNPDLPSRRRLLEHFINKVPNKITLEEVDDLAACFSGYSGAYFKELVNSGFANAVLRNEHEPVLLFSDLAENLDVLRNKEKRPVIGFEAKPQVSCLEAVRASRKEGQ